MYLRVYAVFSPITTIVFAMDNFLRISGYIRYSMSLNVMMSVFCAGIEFLMLGVLGWNIWAAALSNCLGMTLCAAMALIPFLRGKTVLRFCPAPFPYGDDPADYRLRPAQLPKQHCRGVSLRSC